MAESLRILPRRIRARHSCRVKGKGTEDRFLRMRVYLDRAPVVPGSKRLRTRGEQCRREIQPFLQLQLLDELPRPQRLWDE
jgi:hypothetical protein